MTLSNNARALKICQERYDAMEPPGYWDAGPCDCCTEDDCDGCEHADENAN